MAQGLTVTILVIASFIGAVLVPAVLWWRDVIRPGSFQRAGLREVGAVFGLAWLLCGLAMYLVQFAGMAGGMAVAVGVGLATMEQLTQAGTIPLPAQAVVLSVVYAAELGAAALLLYLLAGRAGPKSGIAWSWWDPLLGAWALLLAAPVYVAVSMVMQFVAELVDPGSLEPIAHDTLRQMLEQRGSPWFWVMAAAVVIGAPAAEEIIFRLFLQSAILRWTGSAWAAIGLSAVLFGAVHLGSVPWYAAVVLGVFGLILGIAFERTKRIGVPIVMHALFNAAQIAGSLLLPSDSPVPPA